MALPVIISSTAAKYNVAVSPGTLITMPTGVQDGDMLLLFVSFNTSGETLTPTGTWTNIAPKTIAGTLATVGWITPWSGGMTVHLSSSAAKACIVTLILIRGADVNPVHWVTGTIWPRSGHGTSYTTIAPSIETISGDTLVLSLFGERTTASETDIVSIAGATKYAYDYDPTYAAIDTIVVGTYEMPTIGTTNQVTVTYVNPQAINGLGQQIGVASANPPVVNTVPEHVGYLDHSSDGVTMVSTITLDPSTPTGGGIPATDDWMVATIVVNQPGETVTPPSGWTEINAGLNPISTTFCHGTFVHKRLVSDTSYVFTISNVAHLNCGMFWIRGAADFANWIIGTPKKRIQPPAETVTVTCPAITTMTNNALVTSLAIERTFAAETPSQVTTDANQTKWFTTVSTTSNTIATISAAYLEKTAAGATTDEVFTYPNVQPNNGAGYQIGIPSVSEPLNPGFPVFIKTAGGSVAAHLYYIGSSRPLTPTQIIRAGDGYSDVTTMLASNPFYVAHRGGSRSWPEMSLYAYTQSVFKGFGALEISLARTSDGVWFGLHDATLDRTSGVTGVTASTITWAQVQTYQILGSTCADNPTQPDRPYMRWEEIIAAYYPSHVIFVDPKNALSYRSELMTMMNALPGTPQNHLVCKYYGVEGGPSNTGWAKLAADNGYHRWGYFYQADAANFAAYQGRWDILGMDYTADQPTWNTILSYGKLVIGHILPDQASVTTARTEGAIGLMVSGANAIDLNLIV